MVVLSEENQCAADVAEVAGQGLLELRERVGGGKTAGAEGDAWSHRTIVDALRDRFPDDRIRSEEATRADPIDDPSGRVWIVDPLDGTREFGEGRSDWAVHVALSVDADPVVGAVALPGLGLVLQSGSPPAVGRPERPPRIVVSRTRPPEFVPALLERLGAIEVPMGSAGAKIAAVIRGEAEIYVHAGGQYEWDSAAPVAVALAAGLHATRIDGSPLRYAQQDPWLPDLVVCHPELASPVLAALGDLGLASST
ncbi:MAG: 3'(2'),5'-bisphosphate nucleotidase CysQ [Acidimicrobiales bacterium]|nr:3'(2'),5'-bisphosphate nucleotidase CysQ [Acidimicrobiales bacterium]